jgi:hypothetical protein
VRRDQHVIDSRPDRLIGAGSGRAFFLGPPRHGMIIACGMDPIDRCKHASRRVEKGFTDILRDNGQQGVTDRRCIPCETDRRGSTCVTQLSPRDRQADGAQRTLEIERDYRSAIGSEGDGAHTLLTNPFM